MRRSSQPLLVRVEGQNWTQVGLKRLSLDKRVVLNGQEINELWLQNLLDQVPGLLPVESIDERVMTPLFSLGTEISTPAGPIDNLFLSKNGYLVLVETKLWKNPEARRVAVAQILDYATHLRGWKYRQIEDLWKKQVEKLGQSTPDLWEGVKPEELERDEWIGEVDNNLDAGRMTLLIVGDGIRPRAEKLAEAVNGHPGFLFRLGLIELQLYRLDENHLFVLPATLAKTLEVERAVVRVVYSQQPRPSVSVDVSTESVTTRPPRPVLSEEVFRNELLSSGPDGEAKAKVVDALLSFLRDSDFQIDWKSAGFTIKTLEPRNALLSLGGVSRPGIFYFVISWLRDQLSREWKDAPELVGYVLENHLSFLKQFGAKLMPAGDQLNINLQALDGKEEEFVKGLNQIVHIIREKAPPQISGE